MVIIAMQQYGGGFVQALALAALRADDANLARIKAGWPEYWRKYTIMAHRDALAAEQDDEAFAALGAVEPQQSSHERHYAAHGSAPVSGTAGE